MSNLIGIIVSYIFIGIIIVIAKLFEKIGKEVSRKFIHIMLANWWLIAMCFFDNIIWASFVPFSFIIINYISYKKNLISVMERDKQDGLGTVYYAVSLFILTIFTFGIIKKPVVGLCSVFIMGYGDGLASVIGKSIKSLEYKVGNTTKTIAGSATMMFITFIITGIYMSYIGVNFWIIKAIMISVLITIVESISIKGTDNITVPVVSALILTLI